MYIKNISIQGFKSYQNQIFSDEFSPKHNVIVGKNGSGKSNFFFAIQFVLSETYSTLRAEERKNLLHEGAGRPVMSAYVEIIFDNQDLRLAVDDAEEVRIRRTIGLKKDEFRVNGKTHSAHEVQQLLESAGFSSSNPYYIVQQGKIKHLTDMKDEERLALLKEVAGTKVYEDRRAESVRMMEESTGKNMKITEAIDQLDERLKELEGEKEELTKYKDLDKARRGIEYAIYDKELNAARQRLDDLETTKQVGQENIHALELQMLGNNDELKAAEKRSAALERDNRESQQALKRVSEEVQQLEKKRSALLIRVNDLSSQVEKDHASKANMEEELAGIKAKIANTNKQVEKLKLDLNKAKFAESSTHDKLAKANARMTELYAKRGRASQFKTQADRDKYLTSEIKSNEKVLKDTNAQIEALRKGIEELEKKCTETRGQRTKREQALAAVDKEIKKKERTIEDLTTKRDVHGTTRRMLWKQHSELEKEIRSVREQMSQADRRIEKTMSRDIKQGLDAVRKVVESNKISGVHGPLIELISCDPAYNTAVEETAGNALLHVVVKDDSVASDILAAMNRERFEGRVTFMPLNRLRPDTRDLPRTDEVVPLIESLQFKAEYAKAVQEIFGRMMLAASLEVANSFSHSTNLDCITLEGDKVDRKGALTGGFRDNKVSRIAAVVEKRKVAATYEEKRATVQKLEKQLATLDQTITAAVGELAALHEEVEGQRRKFHQERTDIRALDEDDSAHHKTVAAKTSSMEALQQTAREVAQVVKAFETELSSQMKSQLSDAEEEELKKVQQNVTELKHTFTEAQSKTTQIDAELAALSSKLRENLAKREAQLTDQLASMGVSGDVADRNRLEADAKDLEAQLKELEKQHMSLSKGSEAYLKTKKEWADKIEGLQGVERDLVKQYQDLQQQINAYHSEKSIHQGKRDEALKKIRNLGTMPADASKYQNMESRKLIAELHKTNNQLKAYSHVNKKALEQYTQLVESRDMLTEKKEELDKEGESILQLISHLDNKKDEAILRTFKQVKVEFESIFKQLVGQSGKKAVTAELVMKREEGPQKILTQDTVDSFSGVLIQVSFGVGGKTHKTERLSGGQKSLVALCIIFAIQRCDPAPFYLFDEIDAALDPEYRKAVALMIREQCANAQFITATFHTEMVEAADKHYGILFENKVSRIRPIPENRAIEILKRVQTDREDEDSRKRKRDEAA